MFNWLTISSLNVKHSMLFQVLLLHLIVVLTFIGLALPFAIFPILFIKNNSAHGLIIYSLIISTYPLGQALGMAIFGYLSDTHGRKKILQITLMGALITFILSGVFIAHKYYFLLIVVRFFCGAFEGNVVIAMAAISDISSSIGDKTKWFGRINIALTMGFLVGPLLGSICSNKNIVSYFTYSTPFFVAAILSFCTFILVTLFFVETFRQRNVVKSNTDLYKILKNSIKNISYYLTKPGMKALLIPNLIITAAVDILYQFIPVYLVSKWNATSAIIALSVMVLSTGKIFGNGYFINFLLAKFSSSVICIVMGLGAIIFCLLGLIGAKSLPVFLLLVLVLGVFIPISITNSISLISSFTSKYKQGSILSVASSLRLLIGAIMCNIAAVGHHLSPKIPFLISIVFSVIALLLFFPLMKKSSSNENKIIYKKLETG